MALRADGKVDKTKTREFKITAFKHWFNKNMVGLQEEFGKEDLSDPIVHAEFMTLCKTKFEKKKNEPKKESK